MKICKQFINTLLFLYSTLCFRGGAGILGALCDRGEMHLLSSLQSKGMLGKGQHRSQQSSKM